jgi:hypothetical protein
MPVDDTLRYPVGRYDAPQTITADQRAAWLADLREFPALFRQAAAEADLDRPYREGGWTGHEVVHHVADSHMNSYVRFKLALTEDVPLIKPYEESLWAALPDTRDTPVETSLVLIEMLHQRWCNLLAAITDAQWQRKFRHPEIGEIDLSYTLGLYSWHCRHHLGHLRLIRA